MRLAHFSDIHVTVPPYSAPFELRHPKVVLGTVNYFAGARFLHFKDVEARIARLLEDADRETPDPKDHVLCTGDVTMMSHQAEIDRCAALFGDRREHPERYT